MSETTSIAVLRPDLNQFAVSGFLYDQDFSAIKLLPIFKTGQTSGQYYTQNHKDALRIYNTKRTIGRGTLIKAKHNIDSFSTITNTAEEEVFDTVAESYPSVVAAEFYAAMRTPKTICRSLELEVLEQFLSLPIETTSKTDWGLQKESNPEDDLNEIRKEMIKYGARPNVLAVHPYVFAKLADSKEVKDNLKYSDTSLKMGGLEGKKNVLKTYLGLEDIVILNTLFYHEEKDEIDHLWPTNFAFFIERSSPLTVDLLDLSIGKIATYPTSNGIVAPDRQNRPQINNLLNHIAVETYRNEDLMANIVRAKTRFGVKITNAHAGVRIKISDQFKDQETITVSPSNIAPSS